MINYTDLLGVPYEKGAWDLSRGTLDCWGLALEAFRRAGGHWADFAAEFHASLSDQDESALWVSLPRRFSEVPSPVENDLLTLNLRGVGHVLVYLSPMAILHCTERMGPHIVRWRNIKAMVQAIYRLRGAP